MASRTGDAALKVAIIGRGSIGQALAALLREREDMQCVGWLVRSKPPHPEPALAAEPLAQGGPTPIFTSLPALLERQPEVVVEAAGHQAVHDHAAACLHAGCDVLLASVGALAHIGLQQTLATAAQRSGRQVWLPSGAVGGLDYLQAAKAAGLQRVRLRSSKPPAAWLGSAAEGMADLATLAQPTVFFQGTARQAALQFPKNANVAATVALATLGLDHTEVELMADPACLVNRHEVWAEGAAGTAHFGFANAPAPDNAKTSLITAYSLLRCLSQRRAAYAF